MSEKPQLKLAVLASGTGSLLEAIIEDGITVDLVVADRPCRALEIAKNHGIKNVLLDRKSYGFGKNSRFDRNGFSAAVANLLNREGIGVVSMAGWMTIFSAPLFEFFEGVIINNHPALLPQFKGESAVADALTAGVPVTGCTIHVATMELDDGPILAQAEVPILPGDTVESLHERIKVQERKLLPQTIRKLIKGELYAKA